MSNSAAGFRLFASYRRLQLAYKSALLVGSLVTTAVCADTVFDQADLLPLASVFEQPQCRELCETRNWRIELVSPPLGAGRLLSPSDSLFLVAGKAPKHCGASSCVEAYVLRDATNLRILKSGYEISRSNPLVASDIPSAAARGLLQAVPRSISSLPQAVGLNQGKLAIARDILVAYSNDLQAIDRVADNADYAVLAWAAYVEDISASMPVVKGRGWTPSQNYVIENTVVGDTVATLFISPGKRPVLAFRGTEEMFGDWMTNILGSITFNPLFTAQVQGARALASEVLRVHPDVIFVGHSLGGRLAQVARLSTGNSAVVFNSAFVSLDDILRSIISPKGHLAPLMLFRSPDDPLTALATVSTTVVKNVVSTELSFLGNIVTAKDFSHNMGVMATAMQNVRLARDGRWLSDYLAGVAPQVAQPRAPTNAPTISGCPQAGPQSDTPRTTADCVALAVASMASAIQDFNIARNEGRLSGALGQAMSGVITRNPQTESMQLATCQQLAKAGANELSTAACLALVWSRNPKIRRESSDILDRVLDDVNSRIASNRLPLTTVPATYIVQGGCPGEGCKFGMWTATGTRSMFEKPGSGTLAGQVTRGERVVALRSELRVRPVKGVVAGRIDHLKQGETVYLMDYVGEGLSNTWARGQVFADPRSNDGCTPMPACRSAIIYPLEKAPYEWWVRIQKRDGQSGWIRADLNPVFYGTSWVGGSSVAIPDPYDDQSAPTPSGPQNPSNLVRIP